MLAIDVDAQDPNLKEVLVNLEVKNERIDKVLGAIESQTQLSFVYNPRKLDMGKKVSLNATNIPLYNVLQELSLQAKIKFRQVNHNISIQSIDDKEEGLGYVKSSLPPVIITGRVTDETGQGLPGATVRLKESASVGAVTDPDGNYRLEVPEALQNGTLVISFIGYAEQEIPISNRSTIDVQLAQDVEALQEVVVIGYGTQEERDLTSAISRVKAEEITQTPTGQAMQSLQGRVPGVQIVSSGAPGAAPTVRVRGVGSLDGNASPLYVVDGMFFDNIDFLNPNDIESMSILKDASAAAIYGVRAANGVVLIETKSGSFNQKPEIVYDGYYGVQRAQNILKLANAEQFTRYIRETGATADNEFIENAFQRFGRSRINPNVPNVNTDWYNEVLQTAPIQNHSLSISGGSERTRYSVGANYFEQEGLLQETRNSFERYNLRGKINFNANDWLSAGVNMNISSGTQYVAENSVWFKTYFAVPILPVYDELNTAASPIRLSNAQQLGYRGSQNPFYDLLYNDNRNRVNRVLANVFVDLKLIPDKLTFNTTYNSSYGNINARNVNFRFNDGRTQNPYAIRKESSTSLNGIWDNVLTYSDLFGKHELTAMAGYSFRSETTDGLYARGTGTGDEGAPDRDREELWYLYYAEEIDVDNVQDFGSRFYGSSYFGRISYNYDGRYLLFGSFRRDGTSKFQQRWGNFPTVGAGWVLSEESFFNVNPINFLKFRAGWGRLGNDAIAFATGAPTLSPIFTAINNQYVQGREVDYVYDYLDRWETTEEINVGLSSRLLDNRLSLEADYYIRDTKDAVVTIILPVIRDNIRRNRGEIRNSGFEFGLDWTDQISDNFTYSIGGNIATLKNEVLGLGGQQYLDAGSAEFRQRYIVGEPVAAFFGYEVEGVFQNEQQIANSGYNSEFIADNELAPGDFIYRDQNGDGLINDQDRVVLGSYLPNLTYGVNLGLTWKNLEFTALFQGQSGHSILNRKRGEIIFTTDTNIDADLANNLWRGEGTSNIYPSAAGLRKGWNQNMSDYFVEDGSFWRIQNVRLAYSLRDNRLFGTAMPDARITLTAERPLTVFDYNGFNPEVPDGIDRQTYPIPAVYTLGLMLRL
ncbi:TonB-dependent receptor [Cesiribacter sp. SM1]|uniref:SusC/RagA family TonB-linked outer membrane protein n=1 Tax=Cesiribacter sp. SM1 TaxID=2861196 RepID=UPI001CD2FD2D